MMIEIGQSFQNDLWGTAAGFMLLLVVVVLFLHQHGRLRAVIEERNLLTSLSVPHVGDTVIDLRYLGTSDTDMHRDYQIKRVMVIDSIEPNQTEDAMLLYMRVVKINGYHRSRSDRTLGNQIWFMDAVQNIAPHLWARFH